MVKPQLERILASPEFMASERISQFLRYIVEQTLNGQSGGIKQYTVAVEALGYGADFDPQSNSNVRIHARKLRRALDRYYHKEGIEDPIRIDIPKGSYIPIFLNNPTASEAPFSSECTSHVSEQTPLDSSKPTIAVIMFDCLNDKEQFDHVATGLTEEIIISLTRFPDFLVIGPLNRDVIREQGLDASSIGQKYGARFVLDGAIRTNGQKFRLTVKLADAVSGQQLWGKVLDCSLQNGSTMDFENDVVGHVTSTIADNYGFIPRVLTNETLARHTDSPDAYDAILLYYHHFRVFTQESYINAVNALEKAVQNKPDHALATAALADLITASYLFGYDDADSVLERIEELGRKALALDPNCQTARYTMALIHFFKFERTLFLEEVERALQLNPNNANYIAAASLHIGMVGEWERANQLMAKAMRLNPHHPGWYHIVAYMNYYCQGEYDLALKEARRLNTPDFLWDPLIRAAVLGQLDRREEAKKAVDELLALMPDFKRRGPILIRRLAYLDEHVEMLLDGLREAGLEI
jgi:adenylate cyclase